MAITIETDLKEYAPAYNDLTVVVSSTNSAEPAFKYIFDLYITDEPDFIRFKVDAEPETGQEFGIKDFHKTLEAFITSFVVDDPTGLTGSFATNVESIREYHVVYGEEYEVGGVPTENPVDPPVVGTDKYILEMALPYNQWVDFVIGDWDMSGATGQFLTTQKTNRIDYEQVGYTFSFASTQADIEYLQVLTYDSAGVLIDTYQIQNVNSTVPYQSKLQFTGTGTANLNEMTTGLILGAQPIIDTTVKSYTLQVLDSGFAASSELLSFEIVEECNYPMKRLIFENKYGAFDGFNFDLVSKIQYNIQKKSYKFNPNRVDGAGVLSYAKKDRANVNYHIKSNQQIELNANWISEEESIWLQELFESPEIYLQDTDDKGNISLISVADIQQNTYQVKTTKVDKLFNVDLIINLSNDNYRQTK